MAKDNAVIAQRLIDAGMIIIGKRNLTQLCGLKTQPMPLGYSPTGGQTQSPYIAGGLVSDGVMSNSSPLGSSAGSAVSVSAGFAPLAIGTETMGSLVAPAIRAGL
jgi:amidase